jgi:hypothetical protein
MADDRGCFVWYDMMTAVDRMPSFRKTTRLLGGDRIARDPAGEGA